MMMMMMMMTLKKYRTHHHTAPIKVGYVQFEFSQTENPATQL